MSGENTKRNRTSLEKFEADLILFKAKWPEIFNESQRKQPTPKPAAITIQQARSNALKIIGNAEQARMDALEQTAAPDQDQVTADEINQRHDHDLPLITLAHHLIAQHDRAQEGAGEGCIIAETTEVRLAKALVDALKQSCAPDADEALRLATHIVKVKYTEDEKLHVMFSVGDADMLSRALLQTRAEHQEALDFMESAQNERDLYRQHAEKAEAERDEARDGTHKTACKSCGAVCWGRYAETRVMACHVCLMKEVEAELERAQVRCKELEKAEDELEAVTQDRNDVVTLGVALQAERDGLRARLEEADKVCAESAIQMMAMIEKLSAYRAAEAEVGEEANELQIKKSLEDLENEARDMGESDSVNWPKHRVNILSMQNDLLAWFRALARKLAGERVRNGELVKMMETLIGFVDKSPTLDFKEDRVLSWIPIITTQARELIAEPERTKDAQR